MSHYGCNVTPTACLPPPTPRTTPNPPPNPRHHTVSAAALTVYHLSPSAAFLYTSARPAASNSSQRPDISTN